ncbi:hypothetical protein [Clostridium beijerinckii]|uniref:hypothetical protein n=1 Tax=Clostridium beijerinckii TaxID=1520 RepID=UPI0006852867|nr:hypothetical protein [Clostridium beijerinckii]
MEIYSEVKIIDMEWLSEEANEAIVSFQINNKVYKAFGCPVNFEVGNFYKVEFDFIEGVDVQWDVMFSENKDKIKDLIIKLNGIWSYSAYGQILTVNPIMVDCGIGKFDLGYISRDERLVGEYIFFNISRLNICEW